jgi:hypothetical protein
MELSPKVLGAYHVGRMTARAGMPVLTIGRDTFTRSALAAVQCFNFLAAARLTYAIATELKPKDTRDLFQHFPPEALALPGIGVIGFAVLGAAFEAKRIGTLESYMRTHRDKLVTFDTLKAHEEKEIREERKRTKARKHARRNQAHAVRVGRYEARTGVH